MIRFDTIDSRNLLRLEGPVVGSHFFFSQEGGYYCTQQFFKAKSEAGFAFIQV
jgi:hypothetical protein